MGGRDRPTAIYRKEKVDAPNVGGRHDGCRRESRGIDVEDSNACK